MGRSALDGPRAAAFSAPRRVARVVRRAARRVERRLPGPLGVLAYHRIAEAPYDPWGLSVTPRHFDEQLHVLRELGRIERLDGALAASAFARCRRRRPTFAITFDDGYVDNLEAAVTVLERHDAPATVFIATGLLDEPSFWWDVLTDLIFGSTATSEELVAATSRVEALPADVAPPSGDGDDDVETVHNALYAALIRRAPADIAPILRQLSAQIGVTPPTPSGRPMTTDELLQLASHPLVTIGIHTVNHPRLTLLPSDQVRTELTDGARRLDELLGHQSRVLAYPFGATSPAVADIARSVGISHAVTTDPRWVGLREDPMSIPRLHPHDLGGEAFRRWLAAA